MAFRASKKRLILGSLVAFGGLAAPGCGGGGSSGGVDPPSSSLLIGQKVTVQRVSPSLGLAGSRGSGSNVYVAYNLKDTEFNPADIQLEFGYDTNDDGLITGSDEPSELDEFFPATRVLGLGDGTAGLDTSRGRGADHVFVWNTAVDLPTRRFVTLDYDYSPTGRLLRDSNNQPEFIFPPGLQLRMRATDKPGAESRWGGWTTSDPFDLNNNTIPIVTIDNVGLSGVTPNPKGNAHENVVLNFHAIDSDSASTFGQDAMAVHVDYAFVADPGSYDPSTLVWLPATTLAGTADTNLVTSVNPGTGHTFTWDSVADVGTASQNYALRITPFDAKRELGATVPQAGAFFLDNYTIFTRAGADLGAARVGHQATTLADGRVLITGGRTTTAGASVNTAELFFPSIGQTTYGAVAPTAAMATPRSFHSQMRLLDGRVMVAGGFDAAGSPLSSIEIWDPATGLWTTSPANLGTARARHTAVMLANGDVFIAGGVVSGGNPTNSAVIYNVGTNSVAAVPTSLAVARSDAQGGLMPDGRILVAGGRGAGGTVLASTEIYAPATLSTPAGIAAGPAMSTARADFALTAGTDGLLWITGGVNGSGTALASVESFDYETDSWTTGTSFAGARSGHIGVLLGNSEILIAGGSPGTGVVGTASLYDIGADTHDTPNGVMKTARRDAAITLLNNGRVLIVGGTDATGATLASIEVFTPRDGFNQAPVSTIRTPQEPQSYAIGAVILHRLVDPQGDPAKVFFQYSLGGGVWNSCTPKDMTVAGDVNDGVVSLVTSPTASNLPIDPKLGNTIGDHTFVWDIESDIAVKDDYSGVRVRVIPYGAAIGTSATTSPFAIARNSRVIPRVAPFASSASGNVVFDYHLQDLDGDDARVVFEYGIDLDGDRQIITDNGESWKTCTMSGAGGDGLGAGYTLNTTTTYSAVVGTDADGWHTFEWDSIRDVGSPGRNEVWDNILVRLTPFDFNPGDSAETPGLQSLISAFGPENFTLILDPAGLYVNTWGPEGGAVFNTFGGGAFSAFTNLRLDQALVFNFNATVDPASVSAASMPVTVNGREILGTYEVDAGDARIVRFWPNTQELLNGVARYNGSEDPTVLTRGMTIGVTVMGFVGGTNPETAIIVRKAGWASGDPASDIANLLTDTWSPAAVTTTSLGTAAYMSRAGGPALVSVTPTGAGNANNAVITVTFDRPVNAELLLKADGTWDQTKFAIRADVNGNGILDSQDSWVPGDLSLVNTAGPDGVNQAVFTFTPSASFVYPRGLNILVGYPGLADGDGTVTVSAPQTFGVTGSGSTARSFPESFTSTTNRDSATTAQWNDPAFPGMLTGLRTGGGGGDGNADTNYGGYSASVPAAVSGIRTFSAKAVWEFTNFRIPAGETWRFTGGASNDIVNILATNNIEIAGVLDVSGGDGVSGIHDYASSTSTTLPSQNFATRTGGTGIAGGGNGGNSANTTTTSAALFNGLNGVLGKGGSGTGYGEGGFAGTSYTIGHGGGGGAGHAQNGTYGGMWSTSTSAGRGGNLSGTTTTAGTSYGTNNFAGGVMTAGSGGGGAGACNGSSTAFYIHGGAGGAGGGAVKLACNGSFTLRGAGVIDASGGDGGYGFYYSGGGGGGSGGSVWIIAGATSSLGGIIDIRGGNGGDKIYIRGSSSSTNQPRNFGGTGSAGRIRIELPNVGTSVTNYIGGFAMNSIASGSLTGGSQNLGTFPSSTTTISVDSLVDASGYLNYSSANVPAGVVITFTGTRPVKMRFTGNVTLSGTLRANGVTPAQPTSAYGTYNMPSFAAAAGGPGGYAGGTTCPTNSPSTYQPGTAGQGSGAGGGGQLSYYVSGSYTYYYYSGGGGGASNLIYHRGFPGERARWPSAWYQTGAGGTVGAGVTNPESLAMSSLVGGSGGGGGTCGGYRSGGYGYMYIIPGGGGGSGAGAIGIETAGTFTMASTGRIEVVGGTGGGTVQTTSYIGGGGGGGAGGNVLVRANAMSIASSSTIDTSGGMGQWSYHTQGPYPGNANQYNGVYVGGYYNYTNRGGTGGIGAIRFESVTLPSILNTGGFRGYSASTGTLTTGTSSGGGPLGVGTWQTALDNTLSPDFVSSPVNKAGTVVVQVQGAHSNPLTGLRDDSSIASVDITNGTNFNSLDGYRFFRLYITLSVGTPLPEVYDVTLNYETR